MVGGLVLLLNTAATLFMVGLIWFVQVVHYPLMATLPTAAYPQYATAHQRLTTLVVGPAMLLEAVSSLLLIFVHPVGTSRPLAVVGFLLVVFIFFRTAMLHVPQHRRIAECFDSETCLDLVRTNWWRTIAWTGRGGIVLFLLGQHRASG